MDFTLSPEQLLIKDSVARFAGGNHAGDAWATFAELGWLAIGAPDDLGGFGGALETLLLMEQLGHGAVVSAYVGQAVYAGTLLREIDRRDLLEALVEGRRRIAVADEEAHAARPAEAPATTARRVGDGWTIDGYKTRVLDAKSADTFVVSARADSGLVLLAVPAGAPGVRCTPFPAEDEHDVGDVRFDGTTVGADALLSDGERVADALELARDYALGALCAEAVGLMSAMLDLTVAYTKQRRQFGVAIGSFQALQHRMAEMFVEVELARSMAYLAATTLDARGDAVTRRRGVSAAKVQIARSGRFVGQQTIQLHGGIGMSEEYRAGRYFKRMTTIERLLGDAGFHLARFIAAGASA